MPETVIYKQHIVLFERVVIFQYWCNKTRCIINTDVLTQVAQVLDFCCLSEGLLLIVFLFVDQSFEENRKGAAPDALEKVQRVLGERLRYFPLEVATTEFAGVHESAVLRNANFERRELDPFLQQTK